MPLKSQNNYEGPVRIMISLLKSLFPLWQGQEEQGEERNPIFPRGLIGESSKLNENYDQFVNRVLKDTEEPEERAEDQKFN